MTGQPLNSPLRIHDSESVVALPGDDPGKAELPIYDRITQDHPDGSLIKASFYKALHNSHGFEANTIAGQASLPERISAYLFTFEQGLRMLAVLKDSASASERCLGIDRMAEEFIVRIGDDLEADSERLGPNIIQTAMEEILRRLAEIAARSKQQVFAQALAGLSDVEPETPSTEQTPSNEAPARTEIIAVVNEDSGDKPQRAEVARQARAETVARLIKELDVLYPQMFEDETEYLRLRSQYSKFLAFEIADARPDLKTKVLNLRSSTRHIRLALELAGAHHGRKLSTMKDDWKDHKPPEFKRQPK